jgi:hypothetical protein
VQPSVSTLVSLIFQVDASQGAEEMVEQLTEKTLQLEEKLQQLEEEKSDLVMQIYHLLIQ